MSERILEVAAGLLLRADGHVLLGQRPSDKAWPGWWELPGGKLEPGETPQQALVRELDEELGITVTDATPWVTYVHAYPKTTVRLAFHRVTGWTGQPRGREGQQLAWIPINGPSPLTPLLPATLPPLRWLQLPDRYLITSIESASNLPRFLARLDQALAAGLRLVQFREPAWASRDAGDPALRQAFEAVLQRCRQHDAACLVNSVHPQDWWLRADGVHYRAKDAARQLHENASSPLPPPQDRAQASQDSQTTTRTWPGALRASHYVAVSAHDANDLAIARQLAADFAVLGPVLNTPSHPDLPGRGWEWFAQAREDAGLPVLALGGQSAATRATAQAHGAHGTAGIRQVL